MAEDFFKLNTKELRMWQKRAEISSFSSIAKSVEMSRNTVSEAIRTGIMTRTTYNKMKTHMDSLPTKKTLTTISA